MPRLFIGCQWQHGFFIVKDFFADDALVLTQVFDEHVVDVVIWHFHKYVDTFNRK